MRLFKYVRSIDAVLNIAGGRLKFTPIDELNDPSELMPMMNRPAVRASLDALREGGMTLDQFKWLHCQEAVLDLLAPEEKALSAPNTLAEANRRLSIAAYDNLDLMERKLFRTIGKLRSRVGILSLSLRFDSLPMWAHYADLAQGFVVVLEELERSFCGDNTGSLNLPKPVVYADQFVGMTFDPSTQDRLFFSKLSDWSYEREWRVVTALAACHTPSGSTLYLRNVDPSHVTSVIGGWRTKQSDLDLLRRELTHVNPAIKVVPSIFEGGCVRLT